MTDKETVARVLDTITDGEKAIQELDFPDEVLQEIEHHLDGLRCNLERLINLNQ